jgi:hypothetical protein
LPVGCVNQLRKIPWVGVGVENRIRRALDTVTGTVGRTEEAQYVEKNRWDLEAGKIELIFKEILQMKNYRLNYLFYRVTYEADMGTNIVKLESELSFLPMFASFFDKLKIFQSWVDIVCYSEKVYVGPTI